MGTDDRSPQEPTRTTARASLPDDGGQVDVFTFALPPSEETALPLDEFYRQSILDLLRVVRFSFRGQPVLVDSFAFHHRPERTIPLLPAEPDAGGEL